MVTLLRRSVTIPAFLVAAIVFPAITVVLLPAVVAMDLVRRTRLSFTRALLMLDAWLLCEAAGVTVAGWIWMTRGRDRERYLQRNFRLQRWWTRALFRAGVTLFSIDVRVDGEDQAAPGPVLVFVRHVSPLDNIIPAVFVADRHAIVLRWVLNRALLRDPCLDIVGNRLLNAFVRGETSNTEREIARVRVLAEGLGSHDGVAIFPEGALYTPERRDRVLQRLTASGDPVLAGRAARLRHVLPPRLGGSLALLEAAPGVDVVFCAHSGLEQATRYASIARGAAVGARVRIRFWRVAARDIPAGHDERIAWLLDEWDRVDAFVAEAQDRES